MTVYLSNRDGNGKTNEEGHYRLQTRVYSGFNLLANDLQVTQQTPLAMGVTVNSGDYRIESGTGYAYTGWLDAPANVTIPTAPVSGSRISSIVIYVDKQATTTASPPNNPGITKIIAVQGTAATTPLAPSASAVQSAVGAGNPYYVIANVTVGPNASTVVNANIADLRTRMRIVSDILSYSDIYNNISNLIYPVGSIYTNATNPANPSTVLGFGTWVAYGQGRVLVGINPADSEFNSIGETGGVKANTLTTDQLPAHSHVVDPPAVGTSNSGDHTHGTYATNGVQPAFTTGGGNMRFATSGSGQQMTLGSVGIYGAGNHAHSVDIPAFDSSQTGNNQPVTNLQPYVTVFMWLRTA